jgi:hypothetical protein
MATSALVASQDLDAFTLDSGLVEEVDHLAQTCIVRSSLLLAEGVASLRFGKSRCDLVNQRASSSCDAALQSPRGVGGIPE